MKNQLSHTHTHTHQFNGSLYGTTGWASTRKVKPIWILLKQEILSGSGISWAICKCATRSKQITMPAPLHSVFTGRMPFLPPKQQRQSTEGKNQVQLSVIEKNYFLSLFAPIRELSHSQNSQCIRSLYRGPITIHNTTNQITNVLHLPCTASRAVCIVCYQHLILVLMCPVNNLPKTTDPTLSFHGTLFLNPTLVWTTLRSH